MNGAELYGEEPIAWMKTKRKRAERTAAAVRVAAPPARNGTRASAKRAASSRKTATPSKNGARATKTRPARTR
jgi:hypothetical protein